MSTPTSLFGAIRHPKKRAYLAALVETGGNVSRACELAEIDRSTPYTAQWLQDASFQELLGLAKDMGADHLEAEAIRRAYDGVSEPVGFYKGEPSAYVRKYSDVLLIFLLKGAKREKYVERYEHTGRDGGPIETKDLTDSELLERANRLTNRLVSTNGARGNGSGTR